MNNIKSRMTKFQRPRHILAAGLLLTVLLLLVFGSVSAQGSTFHPTYPFLDKDGLNVLESGNPVSTMLTCGACHDTEFIVDHSLSLIHI